MLQNMIEIKYKDLAKLRRMALCISKERSLGGNLMEKVLFIMMKRLNMKAISLMASYMMNRLGWLELLANFVLESGIMEDKLVI